MVVLVAMLSISGQHLAEKHQHPQAEEKYLCGLQRAGEVLLLVQGSAIPAFSLELKVIGRHQAITAVGLKVEIGVVVILTVAPTRLRKH